MDNTSNNTNIFTLAQKLGAKNLINNPLAQRYLTQLQRSSSVEQQLQQTKTPLGALSSGIALYMQRKQENKALEELNNQIQMQEEARKQKRESLISALPEPNRVIADTLGDEELPQYAMNILSPKADNQILSGEGGFYAVNKNTLEAKPILANGRMISPQKTGTTVNVGDLNKSMTKVDEKVIEKSFEAQAAAEEMLPALDRADQLLKQFNTSPAAPLIAKGQSAASIITGGSYQPKSLSDFQELSSVSKELGARTLQLFGGSDTEKELEVAIKTIIDPSDLSEANKNRVSRKIQAAKILQTKPELQTDWINKHGSILNKDEEGQSFSKSWRNYQKQQWEGFDTENKKQLLKSKYGLD